MGIIAAVVIAAAVAAVWLLLRSAGFQRYIIQKAETSASQALGSPVHVGRLRVHVHSFTPSVDLYDIVIEGKQVPGVRAAQPLVVIPHAHVAVRVRSLLQRSFQIENVELDRPVVHVYVDPQGASNLPSPPGGQGNGPDVFALGIGKLVIRQGTFSVNDREQKINARLLGAALAVGYVQATQSYAGTFRYSAGEVQVAGLPALHSGLTMRFTASRSGVQIPSLVLTAEGVKVEAQARVSDYARPRVTAEYTVQADLGPLRNALREPLLPQGTVEVKGSATCAAGHWSAAGGFSSPALALRLAGLAAPVRNLRGTYRLADDTLQASGIRAAVMGGAFDASVTLQHLAAPSLQATVQIEKAQLGQIARLARGSRATLQALGITGTVRALIQAQASRGLTNLQVSAQSQLAASFGPTPLTGSARVRYSGARLEVESAHLQTPHAGIQVTGGLGTSAGAGAQLQIEAQARDLGELEAVANRAAAALGQPLPQLGLAGHGSLRAAVSGRLAAPEVAGHFDAEPLGVRGTQWSSLQGTFRASSHQVVLKDVMLRGLKRGSLKLQGSLALEQWRAAPASELSGELTVTGLAMSEAAGLVPGGLPLAGIVDAHAQVQGTMQEPVGQGTATVRRARLVVNGAHAGLESATAEFQAAGGEVRAQVEVQLLAGKLQASGTWLPAVGTYSAQLTAPGLEVGKLPPVAATHLGLQGLLKLEGQGQGRVADPEFALTLSAKELMADGQKVQDLDGQIRLAAKQLNATLTATSLQTALHAQAAILLDGNWPATASLDAPAIPLVPVLAAFVPQMGSGVQGQTAVQLKLSGPLKEPGQLQVDIAVPTLEMRYGKALELRAAGPMQAHVVRGVVQIAPAHFTGTGTDLEVQGTVPVPALGARAGEAMAVAMAGNVNLNLADAFVPGMAAGGTASLQLHAAGTLAQPQVTGTIQVSNVSLNNPDWPVALQNGQGALQLHNGRLDLTGFTANVGGGQVTIGGGMTLLPRIQFNYTVAAEQVSLRFPPGLREVVGANVNITGSPAAGLVSGRVRVENVYPAPGFDFATLTNQLAQQTVTIATPGNFLNALRLELAVTTPNEVSVVSRDFSIHANANVNVRGTAQEPVVLGRVDLTSGDLIFRGSRYVIQSGTLDFVNPIRTVPAVNVTADTTIQQYALHLHFQGPLDNLRTSYTSDPALPPADIINLLAFGTTSEASAANPLPGNLGAENLVASAVTSQITDRVQKIAGISHLSVDPVLGGGQQNAGARITLQQRVTANLYVTISTDVTSTQRNVIEVQYRLSPRVSVSGVRKQNGGFGANLQFKKIWH